MYDRAQLALTRAAMASLHGKSWEQRVVSFVLVQSLCCWIRLEAFVRSM